MFRFTDRSPALSRLIRNSDPDLLHAHFATDGIHLARFARRAARPLVVTLHGADVTSKPGRSGFVGRRYRWRLRRLFTQAELFIAVSGFIRDAAIRIGAPADRVVVHHIGIPIPARLPRVDPEWDVAFVGRLVSKKGVADLLAAVQRVSDGRRVRVAIVGDGPLMTQLKAQAKDIDADIEFLGLQPPSEVERVLSRSRVFVGPSQTAPNGDAEGLGMVFLEAAAAGLPVVAYRHGGVVEAVADGVSGLLADEGDVDTLAENLARLLDDEAERRKMGEAARERVERLFDIVRQTDELEDLYDRVIDQKAVGE